MKLNSSSPPDPTALPATDSMQQRSVETKPAPETQAEKTPSSLEQGDQAEAQAPKRHDSEANSVQFGEPVESSPEQPTEPAAEESSATQSSSSHSAQASEGNERSSSQHLESLQNAFREQGESVYSDPAVLKLLDYVREQEDKNVQQMLDMLQQSLDRAREMMEQNKEDFYKKTLPQMQKAEQAIQEMQLNQESLQTQQLEQASSQITAAIQSAQTQLAQAPPGDSPQLAKAQSELAFANVLSTLL